MAGEGIAGHGTTLLAELDPVGAAGVFTLVAESQDITYSGYTTNVFETTPQDVVGIADEWAIGSVVRSAITGVINFVFDNGTHDHLTGFIRAMEIGELRSYQIIGSSPLASVSVDIVVVTAFVVGFNQTAPVRTGARSVDFSLQPTGPMTIDTITMDGT